MMMKISANLRAFAVRGAVLLLISAAALHLALILRIGMMVAIDPQSTTFQRSEAWRLMHPQPKAGWAQQWVALQDISPNLVRAVVASEDSGFFEHSGFDWEALRGASARNRRAAAGSHQARQPKLVGGSTISQQLAKNLFLASERTYLRKAEELVLTAVLELLLSKERILEIYLNSVEWGEGVFGACTAARHYFGLSAGKLTAAQAAQLAVMLPAPKRFEKNPSSPYLRQRVAIIQSRMSEVEWP